EDGTMRMSFCLEGFFGHQTTPGGEIYWFENYHHEREPARGEIEAVEHQEWQRRLLERHRKDHYPVPQLIED
ncbi:hypothetical protein AN219_26855, partial [Streptomyces nanshensis]